MVPLVFETGAITELCWHNIINHLKSLDKSHLANLFSCLFFNFWSMQGILWLTLDERMIGFLYNLPFIPAAEPVAAVEAALRARRPLREGEGCEASV
eukprot:m51a1_g11564 hypothetical protein (97) ;mRNA; r:18-3140